MINKILEDWNNRVGGNLNHKKESHLFELGSMLWEQGWSSEQIGELIRNLVEQETKFKGRTKDGDLRYYKTKDALDKALEKGTVEPVEEPDKKDDEPQQDPTKLSGPKDFERPSSDKKSGDDAKKPKKETASEKKKRREQENINTDNTIKNSDDDNVVVDLVKNRRKEIYDTKDLPAGTPGSTLGETSGGEAFEQLTKNPNLTEEEFVESEHNKLKGTPLYKELEAKAKATKPPSDPEKYVKSWLKVGYKTGKGELKYLESETKFKYKKPQDSPYPIGTTMDYNQKQIVKSVLQKKLEEAKTEQEKKHYQKQLDYVEKLDDTDTGILYETTDGVIGFKHTSNKKNWNDPHNNTSVRKKGEKINNFVDKLELSDENKQSVIKSTTDAIEKAANIVDNAEQVVEDDTKNLSDSGIEKTSKLLSILEPNTKNYVEQIRTASSIKKQFENEGQDLENATELELMKAVIDLIKSGNAPQDIKKILLKTSDIVSRIRQLNKVGLKQYGGPMDESQIAKHLNIDVNLVREALSDELDVIVDTSRKRKDSMAVAHESVVTDLQEADSKIDSDAYPNNLNGDNGPNQQAYVQSFLEEIHFSRYISGELEGVQSINIGGTPVKPNDFRSCLSKLSDFEGDAETPEGKEQLMEHLRKKIRISPTSTSVSFSNKKGGKNIEVGQETYRTKGNSKSILCQLGKDLQDCLKEKVD
tara:strand:- start:316 stop:2418 length:2103 start_codon:yes stop_codon:yes gene_type:complete